MFLLPQSQRTSPPLQLQFRYSTQTKFVICDYTIVMAFPRQKQEAFFAGHVAAFQYLGGVPQRLTYDNLKAAVLRVLAGRGRQEQERFIVFRSHPLV